MPRADAAITRSYLFFKKRKGRKEKKSAGRLRPADALAAHWLFIDHSERAGCGGRRTAALETVSVIDGFCSGFKRCFCRAVGTAGKYRCSVCVMIDGNP